MKNSYDVKSRILKNAGVVWWLVLVVGGCSYAAHYKELTILKKFGESQGKIDDYVKEQRKYFYKLMEDVNADYLKKGMSKGYIIAKYGEPIFCKIEKITSNDEACLYREPLKYFTTDKVYLYFDRDERLYLWRVEKAELYP